MGGLCFTTVIAGSTWIGGLMVFAPLHETTLLFKVEGRFRIADLISLGILLQVAVGAALALTPPGEWVGRAVVTILIGLIVLSWWISGLRMLSRAGVSQGMHRALFLTLLLPSGYVSVLLVIGLIVMFPASMEMLTSSGGDPQQIMIGILLLLLPLFAIGWCFACNHIVRGMADRARDDHARKDGIQFEQCQSSQQDPQVVKYVVGRQRPVPDKRISLGDPIVRASVADGDETSEGIQLIDRPGSPSDPEQVDDSESGTSE